MDRIEFFQSVDQNRQFDSAITSLFDQFSALYNLVGQYDAIKVVNNTEKNKVQFMLTCSDPKKADFIINQILNSEKHIDLYGRSFDVGIIKKQPDTVQIQFFSQDKQITLQIN